MPYEQYIVVRKPDLDFIPYVYANGKSSALQSAVRFRYLGERYICVRGILVNHATQLNTVAFRRVDFINFMNGNHSELDTTLYFRELDHKECGAIDEIKYFYERGMLI